MAEQGVTDDRRTIVCRDGIMKPTNTFVLTFNSQNLPIVVKIGFIQQKEMSKYPINFNNIYLRNKETQQTIRFIVPKQYDASFSANDINSWKQYVCLKLQQVQRYYRLRNHAGMRIPSLPPPPT